MIRKSSPRSPVSRASLFRACHDRQIEVYNPRLDRWEAEKLLDLVASVPLEFEQRVVFTHARQIRRVRMGFGWFKIRLLETHQVLWVLVAHDFEDGHDLILLTNVALETVDTVQAVYADWRLRGRIEHGYRFDQEDGLDVEDVRVRTLEPMRRLFILVLLAAQFVYYINRTWTRPALLWLRQLGGKLGLKSDLNGPYVLLRGISAVWQTVATLTLAATHPFPHESTCGQSPGVHGGWSQPASSRQLVGQAAAASQTQRLGVGDLARRNAIACWKCSEATSRFGLAL
jgi:hypothetical protein